VHPDWKRLALLIGNIVFVLYISSILVENRRVRLAAADVGGARSSGPG
jgi:hypothetical protein